MTSYDTDVKPLFRPVDREAMLESFDLWSYEDVRTWAPAILARLEAGSMPCDGGWPPEDVEVFRGWIGEDMPA
jgi:hypothetical protein